MTQIVCCIDGSAISTAVCDATAWASQRLNMAVKLLHVLEKTERPAATDLSGNIGLGSREHLLEQLSQLDEQRSRLALEHGKHMLEDAEHHVLNQGVTQATKVQRHGALLECLHELQPDTRLFVLGRLGASHEVSAHTLGNHIESVVRSITRSILIAVNHFQTPTSFMLAYDGSETADSIIERVIASPLLTGLQCHLVLVGKASEVNQRLLLEGASRLQAAGYAVTDAIIPGEVQSALCGYQASHGIGLIVMGAYGHSRIRQFFIGSNTSRMISMSDAPLLLLR